MMLECPADDCRDELTLGVIRGNDGSLSCPSCRVPLAVELIAIVSDDDQGSDDEGV